MSRPGWHEYFLRQCYHTATRATCPRKHVGALIVSADHRVISSGYNGAPSNQPSCDEVGCQMVDGHCVRTLHAESNALDFAGRAAMGAVLYCSVTPCWDCAKRIINASINTVIYDEHYESRYGKSMDVPDFLRAAGVTVIHFEPDRLKRFKTLMALVDTTDDLAAYTPPKGVPKVAPESCAVHRFANDVCVICGEIDD